MGMPTGISGLENRVPADVQGLHRHWGDLKDSTAETCPQHIIERKRLRTMKGMEAARALTTPAGLVGVDIPEQAAITQPSCC